MDASRIQKGDSHYPPQLNVCLGDDAPEALNYIGNLELLKSKPLALFCSKKCPGNLILKTYDFAQKLREAGISVISGYHSPVERECLNILLRGKGPIIVCPARGLQRMRIPKEFQNPISEERLLFVSPFSEKVRRGDKETAETRNRVVAAFAHTVFVSHAEKGSKTERLSMSVIAWGKVLFTFEDRANKDLLGLGAKSVVSL